MGVSNYEIDITAKMKQFVSNTRMAKLSEIEKAIAFYDAQNSFWANNFPTSEVKKQTIFNYWSKHFPGLSLANGVERYCRVSGIFSPNYLHDGLFYSLFDPYFNNEQFATQFDNKAYYPLLFYDISLPKTIALRINGLWQTSKYKPMGLDDVINECVEERRIVIKFCRYSCGGRGVVFKDSIDRDEIRSIFLSTNVDMIIQKVLSQHSELNKIHSSSVNTARIMTLLWNNQAHILSSVLRMGRNGQRVDNASSGGIVCGITDTGQLKEFAYDKNGMRYVKHPSGISFSDITVPNFKTAKRLASNLQYRFPYCRMISWDIAIDAAGIPTLIEANMWRGELDFHQFCNGPIFGKLSNEIIEVVKEEVFGRDLNG